MLDPNKLNDPNHPDLLGGEPPTITYHGKILTIKRGPYISDDFKGCEAEAINVEECKEYRIFWEAKYPLATGKTPNGDSKGCKKDEYIVVEL